MKVQLNWLPRNDELMLCSHPLYTFDPFTHLDQTNHLSVDRSLPHFGGRKEMFYLTTHSTHFIYGYMASDIWLRTILIVRKETRCRHID